MAPSFLTSLAQRTKAPTLHSDLNNFTSMNIVTHVKTTIEIADSLLARAKVGAQEQHITLHSLIEESLTATLDEPIPSNEVKPATFKGSGLSRDFEDGSWDKIPDAIYS